MENFNEKPLLYLGGDIMTFGSQLARKYEYESMLKTNLSCDVYSPIANKSINDKSHMTEEENNRLAEKIVAADVERLWKSQYTVMNPEQSAIGTMCEVSILYAWKYMAEKLKEILKAQQSDGTTNEEVLEEIKKIIFNNEERQNYMHYFDIRTNHLNEKDWRRSFSINQFLYGVILAAAADGTLHNSFDEILPILEEKIGKKENFNE